MSPAWRGTVSYKHLKLPTRGLVVNIWDVARHYKKKTR